MLSNILVVTEVSHVLYSHIQRYKHRAQFVALYMAIKPQFLFSSWVHLHQVLLFYAIVHGHYIDLTSFCELPWDVISDRN